MLPPDVVQVLEEIERTADEAARSVRLLIVGAELDMPADYAEGLRGAVVQAFAEVGQALSEVPLAPVRLKAVGDVDG